MDTKPQTLPILNTKAVPDHMAPAYMNSGCHHKTGLKNTA